MCLCAPRQRPHQAPSQYTNSLGDSHYAYKTHLIPETPPPVPTCPRSACSASPLWTSVRREGRSAPSCSSAGARPRACGVRACLRCGRAGVLKRRRAPVCMCRGCLQSQGRLGRLGSHSICVSAAGVLPPPPPTPAPTMINAQPHLHSTHPSLPFPFRTTTRLAPNLVELRHGPAAQHATRW